MMDRRDLYRKLKARERVPGVFYGVRSTGIFCRMGCPSRLPLEANAVFFENAEAAGREGFRPCLRCRPDQDG